MEVVNVLCSDDSSANLTSSSQQVESDPRGVILFQKNNDLYQITRNISARHCRVFEKPPPYLPVSPEGFASFVNLEGYGLQADTFIEFSPYSMRSKVSKDSTLHIFGNKIPVMRRTFSCSGIKCCSTSLNVCKRGHDGIWSGNESLRKLEPRSIAAVGNFGTQSGELYSLESCTGGANDAHLTSSSESYKTSNLIPAPRINDNLGKRSHTFSGLCHTTEPNMYRDSEAEPNNCPRHLYEAQSCVRWSNETEVLVRKRSEAVDYEKSLARQVFFFAQNAFPLICRHDSFVSSLDQLEMLQHAAEPQRRSPNWVFKVGKMRYNLEKSGSVSSSKLPDFIGCCQFGKEGVRDPKKCSLVKIPSHLQGANQDMVNEMIAMAKMGVFPESPRTTGDCPPYPLSTRARFCTRFVHLQESPRLVHVKCEAEYHYLFMKQREDDKFLSWAVIVGVGVHSHAWPVMKPPPSLVKNFVVDLCNRNDLLSGSMILQKVKERFGCAPPPSTVKRLRGNAHKTIHPKGSSLAALLSSICPGQNNTFGNCSYILSVEDQRSNDDFRLTRDQKGLSIIFGEKILLDKAAQYPRFGCDGTFGIVNAHDEDGQVLQFELVSIIAKDEMTGCIYAVMHQLCTRKTTGSRLLFFREFVSQMRRRGLGDPLKTSGQDRLTMATDFETTYAFSLATALDETFKSGAVIDYIKAVAVGCDVHAKRCILEKCEITNERKLFEWAIGTRNVYSREECEQALSFMRGMGSKWEAFADWLAKNTCAYLLWFQNHSCSIPIAERHRALFFDTNPNEAYHNRIKSLPKFAMAHGRGLQILDALQLLRELDQSDAQNLFIDGPISGYPKLSKPQWKRAQSKGRKRNAAEVIVIEDKTVPASQPKRAKKNQTTAKKAKTTKGKQNQIELLNSRIQNLESLLQKVLEKM